MVKFELDLPIDKKAAVMRMIDSRSITKAEFEASIWNFYNFGLGKLTFIKKHGNNDYGMIGGVLYNFLSDSKLRSLPVLRIEHLPNNTLLKFHYPLVRYWVVALFVLMSIVVCGINYNFEDNPPSQNAMALKLMAVFIMASILVVLFDIFCLYRVKQSIKAYLEQYG